MSLQAVGAVRDEGRPREEAPSNVSPTDTPSISNHGDNICCDRCGSPISAAVSIRVGLGRDCRKAAMS